MTLLDEVRRVREGCVSVDPGYEWQAWELMRKHGAQIEAAMEDAERLDWVIPILSAGDEERGLRLVQQIMQGKEGRAAIDSARAK